MQRKRAVVLVTLAVLLAAPATAVGAPSASAVADHGARRGIAPVQAVEADSVVDAFGVGIHLGFLDTPYKDAGAVASALADLGVRHVRDDLYLDNPRQYAGIRTVADEGVRFDLIMGRPTSDGTPADFVSTVADDLPAGAVESLEGVNEWDISGRSDWVAEMKAWQHDLYAAANGEPATSGLPVLAPALAYRWHYDDAGDMSADADLANAHMYPGGYPPSNEIDRITSAMRASIPDLPLVTTEAGYHNATATDNGHLPVPEDVAGVYQPRLLLEHVLRGERRVYGYELIDEFADPDLTNPEAHFGLVRHDLTPKPAYTAMKNLLALLADPGPAFAPGSLPVTVEGFPSDGRYVLTQKRDGGFVLLLWRDVSVFDPKKQEPVPVTPADVTLRLDSDADLTVHRPSDGDAPVSESMGSSLPLHLDGEVTAVEIDAVVPPDPAGVRATRGDRSATVAWRLPPTSAKVTGFEVTRSPGDLAWLLPAGARSFHDTGLTNGTTYSYTVRAVAATASSAAVAAPPVVPATVPTRPGIVSVVPGRHRATVTWTSSSGRGAPVLGYKLVCAGHVVKVGPGRSSATVTGLPSGRRLRVAVRARNDVGLSKPAYTRYVRIRPRVAGPSYG